MLTHSMATIHHMAMELSLTYYKVNKVNVNWTYADVVERLFDVLRSSPRWIELM